MANPVNPYTITITVDQPDRGGTTQQQFFRFAATQCVCTWSWGLQPATALIDWVSLGAQPSILPMAQLTIEVKDSVTQAGLHTFYGICKSVVPVVGSDGFTTCQEFVDSREYLQWDVVYGCFNKRESKLIDGQWVRRYWHILPANFFTQAKTYTNAPLTGAQILDYLFGAPTVESPWSRTDHAALQFPVYDVDCMGGKKLGAAVTEVSEQLGCVFTLMGGRYSLVWTMKGVGSVPDFPANSDNRRLGKTVSGNPTRVRILGERNLYQLMDIPMQPDWLPAWQAFYDLDKLADDLYRYESTEAPCGTIAAAVRYNAISGDTGGLQGRALASARARTITVGAYAAMREARHTGDGALWADYRRFGGRSRLGMPAALYIQAVMFRAFKPPSSLSITNYAGVPMTLLGLELVDRGLVEVTHDPVTGTMSWGVDAISASNGYAIVQGYCVGLDGYKTLRPEHFTLSNWVNGQATWQRLTFQIDDSGAGDKFIVFDQPVISTTDLITATADSTQYPVLNAAAVLNPPPVKASLVFAGEPFSYVAGNGTRDEVFNAGSLNGEFVIAYSGAVTELAYADGTSASFKAAQLAASLLNRQFTYDLGGWVSPINGTQLSPVIDRVTMRWNDSGATEEVDLTSERDRNVAAIGGGRYALAVPPERDYDRRAQLLQLLPGQRELIEQSRQLQLQAASLRQNPQLARTLLEAFAAAFGFDAMPTAAFFATPQTGTLAAGTPLFKPAGGVGAAAPGSTPTAPVFLGVTTFHNEDKAGPVRVSATGDDGVVYARVMGPVAVNGTVGAKATVQTYLETSPTLAVGVALEAITSATVKLIPVRTSSASGGAPVLPAMYRVKSVNGDSLTCRKWDGGSDGPTDVTIALPYRLRASTGGISGVTYTYPSGAGAQLRTASDGTNTEAQIIVPLYSVNDVIFAMEVVNDNTGVSGCTLVDINADGRAWARKRTQP